jgi:hypothetical protein
VRQSTPCSGWLTCQARSLVDPGLVQVLVYDLRPPAARAPRDDLRTDPSLVIEERLVPGHEPDPLFAAPRPLSVGSLSPRGFSLT